MIEDCGERGNQRKRSIQLSTEVKDQGTCERVGEDSPEAQERDREKKVYCIDSKEGVVAVAVLVLVNTALHLSSSTSNAAF